MLFLRENKEVSRRLWASFIEESAGGGNLRRGGAQDPFRYCCLLRGDIEFASLKILFDIGLVDWMDYGPSTKWLTEAEETSDRTAQ